MVLCVLFHWKRRVLGYAMLQDGVCVGWEAVEKRVMHSV